MRKFIFTGVLCGASLIPAPAFADNAILHGLPKSGLNVIVDNLDPDARKAGLNEASLGKVVQGRMGKRHVAYNGGAEPNLFVRVVVLTSYAVDKSVLGYGAHVELSFREKAYLARDTTTYFMAPTWFKGNVTVSNPKAFVADVVRALADLSDQFLNDYVAQNSGK